LNPKRRSLCLSPKLAFLDNSLEKSTEDLYVLTISNELGAALSSHSLLSVVDLFAIFSGKSKSV